MESFYQRLKEDNSRNESLSQTQKGFKEKKIQSQNECDWSDVFLLGCISIMWILEINKI